MNSNRVVLCMKWGTLYPAEYVNVLYRACRAHISGDFRFVCLTNEEKELLPDIEVYPIPLIGLEERHYYNGAWPKISLFSENLYGLSGRCLFIDLDTVIWGSLDDLFNIPGNLVAINNAPWTNESEPRTMSSVFSFEIGSLGSDFKVHPQAAWPEKHAVCAGCARAWRGAWVRSCGQEPWRSA